MFTRALGRIHSHLDIFGSMPLFFMMAAAIGEVRNVTSDSAAFGSLAFVVTPTAHVNLS
jgi:hypothetical protein